MIHCITSHYHLSMVNFIILQFATLSFTINYPISNFLCGVERNFFDSSYGTWWYMYLNWYYGLMNKSKTMFLKINDNCPYHFFVTCIQTLHDWVHIYIVPMQPSHLVVARLIKLSLTLLDITISFWLPCQTFFDVQKVFLYSNQCKNLEASKNSDSTTCFESHYVECCS